MTQEQSTAKERKPAAALALREPARRARLGLLVWSAGILLLGMGAIDLGSALELRVDPHERGLVEYLLLGLLGFLATSFSCYALTDLASWRARGGAGGIIGVLLTPVLLVIDIGLPLLLALAATLALVPELEEDLQATGIRIEVDRVRAELVTNRVSARATRALRRALAHPDPVTGELFLEQALLELRLARPEMLGPEGLSDLEGELEAARRVLGVAGLTEAACSARARGDLESARALAAEARWMWPEGLDPGVLTSERADEAAHRLERLEAQLSLPVREPARPRPVRALPPIR